MLIEALKTDSLGAVVREIGLGKTVQAIAANVRRRQALGLHM